jgi:hypothetical protein
MKHCLLNTIFLFLLCACQKEYVEIPDTGRKIVINGLITTDSLLNIRITKSQYYKSWDYYPVSDSGSVVYFYENNVCIDSLHFSNQGENTFYEGGGMYYKSNYWSGSVYPSQGKEYKIKVTKPGYPEATATTIVPRMVKIERIDTSRITLTPGNGTDFLLNCNITFTDPALENNYYIINVIEVEKFSLRKGFIDFVCPDPITEEEFSSNSGNFKFGYAFSDKLINGRKYNLSVIINGRYYWDSPYNPYPKTSRVYYFRLYSVTEDYFKFIKTLNLFNATRWDPLSEPVMVHSNVTGGYGIFAGAAVSTDSITLNE